MTDSAEGTTNKMNAQRAKTRSHVLYLQTCIVLLTLFLVLLRGELKRDSRIIRRRISFKNFTTFIGLENKDQTAYSTLAGDPPRSKNLKLAMLISFPNSGTSFTLSTVRNASLHHVAGTACLQNEKQFLPIYKKLIKRGPHYIPVDDQYDHEQFVRPQTYILTKTHCSGYDNHPMPSPINYLISQERFTNGCHKVCSPLPSQAQEQQPHEDGVISKLFYFNQSLVGSFVHLFRDPFDNIVSRWHNHMSGAEVKNPHEVNKWEKTVSGFQKFCRERDHYHRNNEAPLLPRELTMAAEGVPCRTDFLRYVQWHNHAFNMTQSLNKPVHILHYLDFQDDYNGTMSKLLDFLELPFAARGDEFRWRDYSDYFTEEQRQATQRFIKFYASPETLHELARYGFD